MKKIFQLTFILILLVFSATAQRFSSQLWHDGVLDLKDGKTLKGKLKYNLESDIVFLNNSEQVFSLNPEQVESFQFTDAITARTRYFFSLPYALQNNYRRNYFFELLVEGKKNLLTREEISRETRYYYDPYWMGSSPAYSVLVQKENYFLMNNEARIEEFESAKDMVELAFSKHQEKIKRYVKMNHLRLENRDDMTAVVDYFNSLESGN